MWVSQLLDHSVAWGTTKGRTFKQQKFGGQKSGEQIEKSMQKRVSSRSKLDWASITPLETIKSLNLGLTII